MAIDQEILEALRAQGMVTAETLTGRKPAQQVLQTIDESEALEKKVTLGDLMDGFERVFPKNPDTKTAKSGAVRRQSSVPSPANDISLVKNNGLNNRFVTFSGMVKSQSKHIQGRKPKSSQYRVNLRLLRKDAKDKLSLSTPAECRCDCDAFNYWLMYVLWKKKSLYGAPRKLTRDAADTRNPTNVPGMCKHLMGFSRELIRSGWVKGTK